MTLRVTGRIADEFAPASGSPRFDLTYSSSRGWSDRDAPILMLLSVVLPAAGTVRWQPIPQPEMFVKPTLDGDENTVASSLTGILGDYTSSYRVTSNTVPDLPDPDVVDF
jgi:hypothetical protein